MYIWCGCTPLDRPVDRLQYTRYPMGTGMPRVLYRTPENKGDTLGRFSQVETRGVRRRVYRRLCVEIHPNFDPTPVGELPSPIFRGWVCQRHGVAGIFRLTGLPVPAFATELNWLAFGLSHDAPIPPILRSGDPPWIQISSGCRPDFIGLYITPFTFL